MPFDIILPLIIITLLGYFSSKFKLVGKHGEEAISTLVFKLLIPLMLFQMMAKADFSGIHPEKIWGAYFGAVAFLWVIIAIAFPLIFKRELQWGVIAGTSSLFANTVMVGIPLIQLFLGERAILILTILLSIHLPTLLTIASIHNILANIFTGLLSHSKFITNLQPNSEETSKSLDRKLSSPLSFLIENLKIFFSNPVTIALIAGTLYRFSGLPWLDIFDSSIDPLAKGSAGLALLALGMSLENYGIREDIFPGLFAAIIKLVIMPFCVFLSAHYIFHLTPEQVAVLTLVASCPTGVSAYIFANMFHNGIRLAANAITTSMLISAATISVWIVLMQRYLEFGLG